MKRTFLFPFFLVLFFLAFSPQAQTWRQFTQADGLPSPTFYTLICDQDGNIWVGMPHAISRINGGLVNETFVDISISGVQYLMESSDGSVWVPTWPGLYRYDKNMEEQSFNDMRWEWVYTMVELNNGTIWSASMDRANRKHLFKFNRDVWNRVDSIELEVNQMIADSTDNLWLVFNRYDENSKTLKSFSTTTGDWTTHLPEHTTLSLMKTSDQRIWAGTDSGLWRFDGSSWQEVAPMAGVHISSLLQTADQSIWAGGRDGLWRFDGTGWKQHLLDQEILTLFEASDGRFWVGTNNGLWLFDGRNWNRQPQLVGIKITKLAESPDKSIWALSGYSLWRLSLTGWSHPNPLKGKEVYHISPPDGVSDPDGWFSQRTPMIETKQGYIWVGTHNSGVWRFDGTQWWQPGVLAETGCHILQQTSDQKILVGTLKRGLWVYDGTKWAQIKELENAEILSILVAKLDDVWVGTFERGLWHYDGTSWLQHVQPSWNKPGDIAICHLLETIDGKIMAGTWGAGLWIYDQTEWKREPAIPGSIIAMLWHTEAGQTWVHSRGDLTAAGRPGVSIGGLSKFDGLTWHDMVSSIYMESCQLVEFTGGGTWFSMSGVWTGAAINWGLWKYDQDKWQEQKILQGIKVTSLLESSDGKLWVGTLKDGLWRYDGQYWHSFTVIDGLPSMRISELIQGRDGSLWIGTGTGISRYQFDNDPPTIQIGTVDGEPVENFDGQDDDRLYITGKPNAFVHWQAFDKETPVGRLTYQYRMNQGDWSQPTMAISVTTPPQESGTHTFTVRAIDRDANFSQTDSVTFIIDLERPEVQIILPKDQTIVSGRQGEIAIRGTVTDKDLDQFRVEFSPLANSSQFQLISNVEKAEKSGGRDRLLGLW